MIMKNRAVVAFALLSGLVVFIAATMAYNKVEEDKMSKIAQNYNEAPFVRDYSMRFGKNQANVSVVEFLDPECGSCAAFHPIMKKVLSDYENEIEVVVRYMANHKNSGNVVQILEAARKQGKYKETLDAVFASQPIWGQHGNPKPHLIWNYIVRVEGLDVEKLRRNLNDPEVNEYMRIDMEDAKALQVTGTPTIFVNGKKLENLTYKALNDLIESELYK